MHRDVLVLEAAGRVLEAVGRVLEGGYPSGASIARTASISSALTAWPKPG